MFLSRQDTKRISDASPIGSSLRQTIRTQLRSDINSLSKMPPINLSPYVSKYSMPRNAAPLRSNTNRNNALEGLLSSSNKSQLSQRPLVDISPLRGTNSTSFIHARHLSSKNLDDSQQTKDVEVEKSKDLNENVANRTKQLLQFLATKKNQMKQTKAEPQSALEALSNRIENRAWPSQSFLIKRPKSKGSMYTTKEKSLTKKIILSKQELEPLTPVNTSSSKKTLLSPELKTREEIPDIGPTRHSLKESGSVKAYAANTHMGLVRPYNEDRVSIIMNISRPANSKYAGEWPNCSYFAVYDGHGGAACADFLRDNLHQMILKHAEFPTNPIEAIKAGFVEAETKFTAFAQSGYELERSGSCAIVVIIIDDMCYVANVGDSRAVMSCEKGVKTIDLSRDHKPSDDDEKARIIKHGGCTYQTQIAQPGKSPVLTGPVRVLPGRLSVSRTFGDIEAKLTKFNGKPNVVSAEPEIKSFKLTDDCDFIVLGCDGIYDKLTSEEATECIWNATYKKLGNVHMQAAVGVEYLMKHSFIKRTTDNITVVLVALAGLKESVLSQEPQTEPDTVQNETIVEDDNRPVSKSVERSTTKKKEMPLHAKDTDPCNITLPVTINKNATLSLAKMFLSSARRREVKIIKSNRLSESNEATAVSMESLRANKSGILSKSKENEKSQN